MSDMHMQVGSTRVQKLVSVMLKEHDGRLKLILDLNGKQEKYRPNVGCKVHITLHVGFSLLLIQPLDKIAGPLNLSNPDTTTCSPSKCS